MVIYVFHLLPGATIYATGDTYFLNASKSGSFFSFTVINATSGEPLSFLNSLADYGRGFPSWGNPPWRGENWYTQVLGLNPREIIVPANMLVSIEVKTLVWAGGWYGQKFIMDNDGNYYNLTQGELIQENLSKYSLRINFITAENLLNSTSNSVSEASNIGFYVTVERNNLLHADSLIRTARDFYNRGDYSTAHSYLREAYITITNVSKDVKDLFGTASLTAVIGPVFLAVMAVTLGFFFLEDARRRFVLSLIILAVFLTLFYFLFPGCRITGIILVCGISVFSLVFLHSIIPELFRTKIERKEFYTQQPSIRTLVWSIFSLAKRNLKRRKLRSALSIVNLSILTFALIVLTSTSMEFGLLILTEYGRTAPTEGVLIRSFGSLQNPRLPLSLSLLDWLSERPEVQMVVPKAESIPQLNPQTSLITSNGTEIPIFGILGIYPSLEKNITRIQDAVISGSFLEDNMTYAILLSKRAADNLGVKVGDHVSLYNISFEIVGILDDEKIERIVDLDGYSILPQKLITSMFGPVAVNCASDNIVITTFHTALMLPNTMISRVDVILKENEDLLGFARLVVFNQGLDVWAATSRGVFYVKIGQSFQSSGMTSIVPLQAMVILSVALHFIGSIRERKNEIFSMSSQGVNPTHIMIIFISEAVILGIISGGIGYFAGLSSYQILSSFAADLMIKQKASIEWGLLAILFTISTAIIASIFPAMKASTLVTPSLQRKWSIRAQGKKLADGTWTFTMPIKVPAATINFFLDFLEKRLRAQSASLKDRVKDLRFSSEEVADYSKKTIQFRYISGEIEGEGFTIDNEINLIKERDAKEYSIYLKSRMVYLNIKEESRIHENISFLRRLILEWTTIKFKIVAPEGHYLNHLYTLVKNFHPTTINLITFTKDPKKKIYDLSLRLDREGEPVPRFNLVHVEDPSDVEEVLKKVREVLKEKDINLACVNGGPENICSLLAVEAKKREIATCCVWDERPLNEQEKEPYYVGKVIKIG